MKRPMAIYWCYVSPVFHTRFALHGGGVFLNLIENSHVTYFWRGLWILMLRTPANLLPLCPHGRIFINLAWTRMWLYRWKDLWPLIHVIKPLAVFPFLCVFPTRGTSLTLVETHHMTLLERIVITFSYYDLPAIHCNHFAPQRKHILKFRSKRL